MRGATAGLGPGCTGGGSRSSSSVGCAPAAPERVGVHVDEAARGGRGGQAAGVGGAQLGGADRPVHRVRRRGGLVTCGQANHGATVERMDQGGLLRGEVGGGKGGGRGKGERSEREEGGRREGGKEGTGRRKEGEGKGRGGISVKAGPRRNSLVVIAGLVLLGVFGGGGEVGGICKGRQSPCLVGGGGLVAR